MLGYPITMLWVLYSDNPECEEAHPLRTRVLIVIISQVLTIWLSNQLNHMKISTFIFDFIALEVVLALLDVPIEIPDDVCLH